MPTYSELRPDLATGDIALFSGSKPVSAAIRAITRSRWSHVGLVYRPVATGDVLVWESTKEAGVHLAQLSERIADYDDQVGFRSLLIAQPTNAAKLEALRHQLNGRDYEESYAELIRAARDFGPFHRNEEDLSSLFYSELVAEAYQALGLLSEKKPSNEYTPADFARRLPLLDGELADVVELTRA